MEEKQEKVKHTAGPWTLKETDDWPFPLVVASEGDRTVVQMDRSAYSTDQKSLAECLVAKGFKRQERNEIIAQLREQQANARLVAAAPDLLAACELALARLHQYATDETLSEDDACVACADLECAIYKATGESQ